MKLHDLYEGEKNPKTIDIAYEIVTPESAEHGDIEDQGWEEQDIFMEPDEYDSDDGITAADKAIEFISDRGPVEPSSSVFGPGVWYTTTDSEKDFRTGSETRYSFHLNNFTTEEERQIFNKLTK